MEFRKLGRSGLNVSTLCLGTMMFGARTEEAEAGRIVASARDAGVNFIDTADGYANGESERIVGRLIGAERDHWVLATKGGSARGVGPNQGGLSRKWLIEVVDASLRRLGTDYIDVYYLHRDDRETPLDEAVATLATLIDAGKIRYWGFSNFEAWRVGELMWISDRLNAPQPIVCQPYYHALNRQPEAELLAACAHFGIGVAPYSPLARGVLTGKYVPGEAPDQDSRAGRKDERLMETAWGPEALELAQKIKVHAEARGMTATAFAVLWVLNCGAVSSVIAGPRTFGQWTSYLDSLKHTFTAEDEAFVDGLVPSGHASSHGFQDPKMPPRGRAPRTRGMH